MSQKRVPLGVTDLPRHSMPPVANPNPDRAVRPRPTGAAEQELVIAPAVGAAAAPIGANAMVPQAVYYT